MPRDGPLTVLLLHTMSDGPRCHSEPARQRSSGSWSPSGVRWPRWGEGSASAVVSRTVRSSARRLWCGAAALRGENEWAVAGARGEAFTGQRARPAVGVASTAGRHRHQHHHCL